MAVAGIVAEYNPFHTGHAYQISQVRRALGADCAVVAAMSGNWVQRGDCAVADKWTRAAWAVAGGADLVLEVPTVWAVSSAESFARGGVGVLQAAGVVDTLAFGSERGELERLRRVAACLDGPTYAAGLRRFLDEGMPFAACRQAVVRGLLGPEDAACLDGPNDNLGVEYLRAARALGGPGGALAIPRQGAAHGQMHPAGGFASASLLREWLSTGLGALAAPYLPTPWPQALPPACLAYAQRAVLYRLRTMTAQDWAALPDAGAAEGLPQRLEQAGRQAAGLEEFYALAKTKRYPLARLRRLALWAYLGLTAQDRPQRPPYLRVLALNGRGREVLRDMRGRASAPILTKPAHARQLSDQGRRLFELEARCTDLYGLCHEQPQPCGLEWTTGPAVTG